jgi:gluconate 5-dehydrogenase
MAIALAGAGASLVLCGRRRQALEATADHIISSTASIKLVPADLTVEEDVVRLGQAAGNVDILVNNAGANRMMPWHSVPIDDWRSLMALNLDAPFRLCQLFAPAMVDRGWGRIINVASVYGVVSGDPRNYPGIAWDIPGYVVSKHALIGLTKYLATVLADKGVCVNAISPGMFATEGNKERLNSEVRTTLAERTPMRRLGEDDDLKAAVVFLASPGAKFVTGQNLIVDGGFTTW